MKEILDQIRRIVKEIKRIESNNDYISARVLDMVISRLRELYLDLLDM